MILRHGYTLKDLHAMARLAVHTAGRMASDWHERYNIAYSAITELLYSTEHWPTRSAMVQVGKLAIYAALDDHRHHHGYYKYKTIGGTAGPGSSPAFNAYWESMIRASPSCENRVVENLALHQIWPTLTDRQQEAVATLAAFDDYRASAVALGITPQTYIALLGRARKAFFALWHEGEMPSTHWGTDRRVYRYDLLDDPRSRGSDQIVAAGRRVGCP